MLFNHSKGSDLSGSLSPLCSTALLTIIICLSLASASAQAVKDQLNEPSRYTIVLDAGHGGKDSGCLGSRSMEKDIALSLALQIGQYIDARRPLVDVIYTRKEDVFVPLHERSKLANERAADLFISVHCNGVHSKQARGTETYVMGLHTAAENLEVAKRENKSILMEQDYDRQYQGYDPDSPVGHILLSSYQNQHLDQSLVLAESVQKAMTKSINVDRGVKQAGFVVLRRTAMPSILIEAGFLTNPQDEAILVDPKRRSKLASDLAKAILDYVDEDSRPPAVPIQVIEHRDAESDNLALPTSIKTQVTEKRQYALQIGAFSKALSETQLHDYEVFPHLKILKEDKLHKVHVGLFSNLPAAVKYQQVMHQRGYKGAFVVEAAPSTVR